MAPLSILLLTALTLSPFCGSSRETPSPLESLIEARELTERACISGEKDLLYEARARFEALTSEEDLAAQALYFVAYVDSVLASRLGKKEKKEARGCIEHGIQHLKSALLQDPGSADAHAMLGMLYLQQADRAGLRGLSLARSARLAIETAVELDGRNPRVRMLQGVRLWNLPRLMGGSKKKARAKFEQALRLFAEVTDEADPRRPSWGHADAHVWNGVAAMDRGELEAARSSFRSALELRPGYVWVKDLQPALEALAGHSKR
jgi:tetratricopeptide (TPR) repeat protein